MRKEILLPGATVALGVLGFGRRRGQLATAFEPETGLAIPGAPATRALIALAVVTAVLILVLTWGHRERKSWDRAFYGARGCPVYMTAMVLAAFLLLASGGLELYSYLGGTAEHVVGDNLQLVAKVLHPLRIALCLGGFPCVLIWGRSLYRGTEGGKESLPLLEVCLLYCVWLVSNYQTCAADPVVLNYIWTVLAICGGLLGVYYVTSYSFQKVGCPRRSVLACLMGAFFSITAMGGDLSLAELLRCAFAAVFLLAHAALLLQDHPAEMAEGSNEEKEAEENA